MEQVENLIIGAGPAGLATAGRLRKAGLEFTLLEQTNTIATSWQNHYDGLHLHTVNPLSHLPHLPFPEGYPLYVSKEDLVSYYQQYAESFDIKPIFNQKVTRITQDDGHWQVEAEDGSNYQAKNVIVATGINRIPKMPSWDGQDQFQGDIIHASTYKNATPYKDKKVLIVGMGNTGAEIALHFARQGDNPHVSLRGPVHFLPRDINGRPTQLTALMLAKIPFGLGDTLGSIIRKIVVGDLSKYGISTPKLSPTKQLKVTGRTPVVDIGTLEQIKNRNIKIMPDIKRFGSQDVQFANGESVAYDLVILATGYYAQIDDFMDIAADVVNKDGLPSQAVFDSTHKGLYFVGFNNYVPGGALGVITSESEEVVKHLLGKA